MGDNMRDLNSEGVDLKLKEDWVRYIKNLSQYSATQMNKSLLRHPEFKRTGRLRRGDTHIRTWVEVKR